MASSTVTIWQETVLIPTYGIGQPDKNPMFFEKRIYQGSSGVVYPNPVIEKIEDEKEDKPYAALFLENEYIKVMILPELGGRIQMAWDKLKQRHFIYYNQVIKPALVGLTGPWISGGIEFNWPQHHRPSTFEPIDYDLEEQAGGSKTVWVNEVERMFHTKGMAGFTLHPGKAYLEIRAKLYNRTPLPQTFLWWANPAVKVNDDYQSVFPPDVNAVFDHGRRDVSSFPIATGTYYKVDYSPGTDISRYKNIPVPTSYMAVQSAYDFVGGYEHDTQAGVLHVADHHVSPGKKQWTWGHSDFGQAWDRNLTDEDGPYIEIMTGVFTDNQPDFSWIMPGEERTFSQYFLPYRELGVVKNATKDLLAGMERQGDQLQLKIFATSAQPGLKLTLSCGGTILLEDVIDGSPETVITRAVDLPAGTNENELLLQITNDSGREILRYEPAIHAKKEIPEPAKAALAPEEISTNDQLFLTGQHLEQYRHATFSPVPYYEEALKRDPDDSRCNNALGVWLLRRGQFERSVPFFRRAISSITSLNPNPYDGEPYYNLGLALHYLGENEDAYSAFYKAAWNSGWQDKAYFFLAAIRLANQEFEQALAHINQSLDRNAGNSKAYVLKSVVLRLLHQPAKALAVCNAALERDRFNLGAWFEKSECCRLTGAADEASEALRQLLTLSRQTEHNLLAYALDYSSAGQYSSAIQLLNYTAEAQRSPLFYYHQAYFNHQAGDEAAVKSYLEQAAEADAYLCFPNRPEDLTALQFAIREHASDSKAPYYLGNLWYDKRQYAEAMQCWQLAVDRDATFPTVHRNLGIAAYNKLNDREQALRHFETAFSLDTSDARVLMELDQVKKRLNHLPRQRLAFLEEYPDAVNSRDDLYLERASLYNFLGNYHRAYELIGQRQFHPWEGGEGRVTAQYIFSLVEVAKENIASGTFQHAIKLLEMAQVYPHNLGEGKLYGAQENDVFYWLGIAYQGLKQEESATAFFSQAAVGLSKPGAALFYNDQQPDKIFYQGLARQKLGNPDAAAEVFNNLVNYGETHRNDSVMIDYFAVSLPNLLIFDDDLEARNRVHCGYIAALGLIGLNRWNEAAKELNTILAIDAMHFGAATHLRLITGHSTLLDRKN